MSNSNEIPAVQVLLSELGLSAALELISTAEMLGKLKAALAARCDAPLAIVARTAALRVEPIEKVVARVREIIIYCALLWIIV